MADAAVSRIAVAERREKLAGRSAKGPDVTVTSAPPAARLSLRAPEESVDALSRALGVTLPRAPKSAIAAPTGGRAALWLGPDEWLVLDATGAALVDDASKVRALHSAVDVSHRNVAILVEGPGAEACLAAGCPQDLSPIAFPEGACSRTVLGKVEIVLWRTAPDVFRVEVWRSYSEYVFDFLAEAARDASA